MTLRRTALPLFLLVLCLLALVASSFGQTETATLSGLITDPQGKVVPGVAVEVTNVDTNVSVHHTTNGDGLYVVVDLKPGRYRVSFTKEGFRRIDLTDLVLNVQDVLSRNFQLQLGPVMASITVVADEAKVNTTDATVSTVVDRNFAENLPMNGRSFQTLIQLTPGVVLTPTNTVDSGQFSVNGQRASSNYWMVDGVSANIGISAGNTPANGLGGTVGSFSAFGGTNSLVSVDALQEFRIQTSTYAPEFGRTPGAQISIVTRSGTNQFHGAAFDYLRNDVFDASNWFNGYTNNPPLPKARERQNDFGGTLSGPILRDKTFFFFSYEGLRLRLPQTEQTNVPDVTARQNAGTTMQPYLNAYPLPNGSDNLATGVAQFNASFSNPATLDAYSLRIDHKLSEKLNLFGRYNYSPSELDQRGAQFTALSTVFKTNITTQTATAGLTWTISPVAANDLRFNYSSTKSSSSFHQDTFGGAVPLAQLPFPNPFTAQNANFIFGIFSLGFPGFDLNVGRNGQNRQQQLNVIDSVSVQRGSHSMKFGVDFRRMSPQFSPSAYLQEPLFLGVSDAETGNLYLAVLQSGRPTTFLFRNLGLFGQDTWRIAPRVTITYGLRWDVDFVPSSLSGPDFNAVTGFNLSDLSNLALAPSGTAPYKTRWGNFAPRIGLAYQVSERERWQAVLRGGFGVFYDLASAEAGNNMSIFAYPFGGTSAVYGPILGGIASFPLSSTDASPPAVAPPDTVNRETLQAFDPNLKLPYTLQWTIALEQALGRQQTITASYVGSTGKRLLQTALINSPNSGLSSAELVTNGATSNYNALQLQFQRRLSHGLQALASYTWSHSIDTASSSSLGSFSNALAGALNPDVNRASSDFDIRSAFSLGLTYDVPAPKLNAFANAFLRGWSTENIVQVNSAPPVDVFYSGFAALINGFRTDVRPDLVTGVPLYQYGSQYPGGKAFNNTLGAGGVCSDGSQSIGPFCPPPTSAGVPVRQGSLPRNALRGFGASQWNFAIRRDFPIRESVKIQFRTEMFNILNHPNFGQPVGDLGSPAYPNSQFGRSNQMLGQSLSGGSFGAGTGGFNALYQIGGPRSIQLSLKLLF